MCGIFGVFLPCNSEIELKLLQFISNRLFQLSETRGRESAGLALLSQNKLEVMKGPLPPAKLIRQREYKGLFRRVYKNSVIKSNCNLIVHPIVFFGHTRLVTDGLKVDNDNNQPVIRDNAICIHNGIVVNASELFTRYNDLDRKYEVDTEVILALVDKFKRETGSLRDSIANTFGIIKGSASVAILNKDNNWVGLATNTGSLFLCRNSIRSICFFASERYIVERIAKHRYLRLKLGDNEIWQLKPGKGIIININDLRMDKFKLSFPSHKESLFIEQKAEKPSPDTLQYKNEKRNDFAIPPLNRCTRCILPETVPYINFDDKGVCNFCRNCKKEEPLGHEALEHFVANYRSKSGDPDCIIGLSGGRDSCYGLHYLKRILGLNPIAFTYDWGMVTDLARRNQARMCGKLGVEHIIVSADIEKKRKYIRNNIKAWLNKPDLGMIPIFMAGDKHFFYYGHKLRKMTGIKLLFWCSNPFEMCVFKAGFAGVVPKQFRLWNISIFEKVKIASYYAIGFLKNPVYFNASFWDTLGASYWSWLVPQNLTFLYKFIKWDEDEIMNILRKEYEWEDDSGTKGTWRIGDATAAFYNYIYYRVAGVTENDTFRSNQIREGMITRDEAIALVEEENRPRYDSLQWYAEKNGFDLEEAIKVIDSIPPIYK
jgi:asparagine synthetase B (glutamine-hydrolysing)